MNVNQNLYCNLDETGHVSKRSRRTCWKMPEYDEKMDYIIFEDYDLTYEEDKWVLIEDIKHFQTIIEDFMQYPVSSEKKIRTEQMKRDVDDFLLRKHRLDNYDNKLEEIKSSEVTAIRQCSINFRKANDAISDSNCPYWGDWKHGSCSQSCGSGMKTITRNCLRNGYTISVSLCQLEYPDQKTYKKTEYCTDQTYCLFDSWQSWGQCDKTCGTGTQKRWRNCPSNSCRGSEVENRPCNTQKCPHWGDWIAGYCSQTCGSGQRTLRRNCYYNNNEVEAAICQRENPDQKIYLKTEHCTDKTHCDYEQWGSWNRCDKDCGTGTQKRLRNCPSNACSGPSIEKRLCNTRKCVTHWTSWTSSGGCSRVKFEIFKITSFYNFLSY